jgi:hypothetical protein
MKIRWEPGPSFIDQLGNSRAMQAHLRGISEDLRRKTDVHLPGRRRRTKAFTGRWMSRVEGSGREVRVQSGTRWRLGHVIEYGSANNRAYAPLRRAVRAMGLKFGEGR